MTTRVVVLDDYQGRAHEFGDWASLGDDVDVSFFHAPLYGDALTEALSGVDILVLMRERTPLQRQLIDQLPNLRFVVTTGMHNASVDLAYLRERGIAMSGTEGGGNDPVEVAWALILAIVKRVTVEDRAIRDGLWQLGLPTELSGATLGLAGLGRLGSGMVAPARAFGMNVIAWSQNLTDERAAEVGVKKVTKDELLRESDVLSIHLVLSDRTRGLFGATDLATMKPSAVLINTSRGPIVEETALVDALRSGTIAAAGLDVFDVEPLPAGHPLRSLENTVLAPHLGYVSEKNFRAMYTQAVENIAGFLANAPVRVIE
jgi:phosphoglycerate dehydrogenase-like enzyme